MRDVAGMFKDPSDPFAAVFFGTLGGQRDHCVLEVSQKVDRTDILHHGPDPVVERSASRSRSTQQLLDDACQK